LSGSSPDSRNRGSIWGIARRLCRDRAAIAADVRRRRSAAAADDVDQGRLAKSPIRRAR
jgi:hypothetical protein